MSPHKVSSDEATEQYFKSLPAKNVAPLWTVMGAMVPPKPKPKAQPVLWKYNEIRPLLLEAGEVVNAEEAERRVLMLVNPAMSMFRNDLFWLFSWPIYFCFSLLSLNTSSFKLNVLWSEAIITATWFKDAIYISTLYKRQ